ncbi:hypothetical protein [Thermoproteus tenax]|uniref:Bacterial type II/IV secretion system protein n=1 Tax=Thermoproteus tenax (strain ATCC 35583 / DSM 2078 / JCM 9277 / NBRC 100435 / Kra 1) TaxID=768679 RepID=G4RPX3_THETK|nr:hypothetical protein [Thermoproteus tenax]CCC81618.1 bacterial type II/IV secretion system protein [Thermoproteus tenax Kra 1]
MRGQGELVTIAAMLAVGAMAILIIQSVAHATSWELCKAAALALQYNGSAFRVESLASARCSPSGCQLSCGLFVPADRVLYVEGRPALGGLPGVVIVGSTPDGKLYIIPVVEG